MRRELTIRSVTLREYAASRIELAVGSDVVGSLPPGEGGGESEPCDSFRSGGDGRRRTHISRTLGICTVRFNAVLSCIGRNDMAMSITPQLLP